MLQIDRLYTLFVLVMFSKQYESVNCYIKSVAFFNDVSLNDKICIGSEKVSDVITRSQIYCAVLCVDSPICAGIIYSNVTATCTLCSGHDNLQFQNGTLFYVKQKEVDLEGKVFRIYVKETNKFWHYDGNNVGSEIVSCRWQPNDDFSRFTFEKQGDGSYRIKSVAVLDYMYDGSNSADVSLQPLSGVNNRDDDHGRFILTQESGDYFRIQTKASGRYVRADDNADESVTTLLNIKDDRSLFTLIEE